MLPSSRDRRRGYDREPAREKEPDPDRRRRRHRRDDGGSPAVYEEVDIVDDDEDRERRGYRSSPGGQRPRRHREPQEPQRRARRYDPHGEDEEEGESDGLHDAGRRQRRRHRRGEESQDENVIFVDSRPSFNRPPKQSARPTTPPPNLDPRRDRVRRDSSLHDDGRRRHLQYQQRRGEKAKESPATSPIKRQDRERDRAGDRRRRDSTADEGSPTKKLRERKGKERYQETRDEPKGTRSGGEEWDREQRRSARRKERESKHASAGSANSATQLLSANALAKLDARNQKGDAAEKARREKERRKKERGGGLFAMKPRGRGTSPDGKKGAEKRRLVSGAILEEGRSPELRARGGYREKEKWRKGGGGGDDGGGDDNGLLARWKSWSRKRKICVVVGILAVLLIIIVAVAVVVSKRNGGSESAGESVPEIKPPPNHELRGIDRNSIPADKKGSYYDPFSWFDTTDFNVTFTTQTVGGLPIMGLNSTWDDSARPNEHVPPLNERFPYGRQPIRGVNLGGWLALEPFITPSYFDEFRGHAVDEWTLSEALGKNAKGRLEQHYASFITEESFREIRDAGLDHVRIPYGYWAVATYEGVPYVHQVSWRYLLRAIEYCRKYGLRVSLDMHGAPGSQNGWNHSGQSGTMKWLNGPDGELWGQRALDIHNQLSQFFAQPRYKNVVTMYGLVNEPMMLKLEIPPVLEWTTKAAELVTKNGIRQHIVFGDGFLLLSRWKTMLQDTGFNFVLDTHQYTIFNNDLVRLKHQEKLEFVCKDWVKLIKDSNTKGTGWGPTICGEWSQADTDCAKHLNNVGIGSRWEGTMNDPGGRTDQVLSPLCPTEVEGGTGTPCSCKMANADPSEYTKEYKAFLKAYAEAQISAFEQGWGWFYWTWKTESAVQWSWKKGLEAGTLPAKAYEPAFKCGDSFPDLGGLPEHY